jgi:NAD(P)-dependent dehydrogenase (short-subunit alcohol dehydrogenase family)
MSKVLQGKVALVTGASRGIGRAIAKALAADGALVAVHYGKEAGAAEEVVTAIRAEGGQAFAVQADFAKNEGPRLLFEALDDELNVRTGSNQIDILVNNAGVAPMGALHELPEAEFDRLHQVNVRAVYFVTKYAAERIRDNGRVINVSSGVTRIGFPAAAAYAGTKGWVNAFTLSAAATLGHKGVTVNAVEPGVTATDMAAGIIAGAGEAAVLDKQVLKRIGQPEDIANLVRALAGPAGGWTTGQAIDVSGGSLIAF